MSGRLNYVRVPDTLLLSVLDEYIKDIYKPEDAQKLAALVAARRFKEGAAMIVGTVGSHVLEALQERLIEAESANLQGNPLGPPRPVRPPSLAAEPSREPRESRKPAPTRSETKMLFSARIARSDGGYHALLAIGLPDDLLSIPNVYEVFASFGPLVSVILNESKTSVVVQYKSGEDAAKALQQNVGRDHGLKVDWVNPIPTPGPGERPRGRVAPREDGPGDRRPMTDRPREVPGVGPRDISRPNPIKRKVVETSNEITQASFAQRAKNEAIRTKAQQMLEAGKMSQAKYDSIVARLETIAKRAREDPAVTATVRTKPLMVWNIPSDAMNDDAKLLEVIGVPGVKDVTWTTRESVDGPIPAARVEVPVTAVGQLTGSPHATLMIGPVPFNPDNSK